MVAGDRCSGSEWHGMKGTCFIGLTCFMYCAHSFTRYPVSFHAFLAHAIRWYMKYLHAYIQKAFFGVRLPRVFFQSWRPSVCPMPKVSQPRRKMLAPRGRIDSSLLRVLYIKHIWISQNCLHISEIKSLSTAWLMKWALMTIRMSSWFFTSSKTGQHWHQLLLMD